MLLDLQKIHAFNLDKLKTTMHGGEVCKRLKIVTRFRVYLVHRRIELLQRRDSSCDCQYVIWLIDAIHEYSDYFGQDCVKGYNRTTYFKIIINKKCQQFLLMLITL